MGAAALTSTSALADARHSLGQLPFGSSEPSQQSEIGIPAMHHQNGEGEGETRAAGTGRAGEEITLTTDTVVYKPGVQHLGLVPPVLAVEGSSWTGRSPWRRQSAQRSGEGSGAEVIDREGGEGCGSLGRGEGRQEGRGGEAHVQGVGKGRRPGSSLPSTQSQKSSLTLAKGTERLPSLQVNLPEVRAAE